MRISDWSSDVCSSDLLQQLERLRHAHQWGDVADWTDIDLVARQKGHRARKIDGETAFDAAEDHAFDALLRFKLLFKHVPCGFAARAVARQHRFALGVFDSVHINFNFVANLDFGLLAGGGEFAQRDSAFGLEANVDHGDIVFNCGDDALDHAAFEGGIVTERLIEKRDRRSTRLNSSH